MANRIFTKAKFGEYVFSKWWFQMFLFSPLLGEMIQFDSCFSTGLKPPSSFSVDKRCVFFSIGLDSTNNYTMDDWEKMFPFALAELGKCFRD